MRLKEFLFFAACLLVSVFLLGMAAGLAVRGEGRPLVLIGPALLINGLAHFFLWKKFWGFLKSLAR